MHDNLDAHFKELFDKTREITGIGVWYVNIKEKKVIWDERTKKIHDVPMDFEPDLATGINFYKTGYSRDEITRLCDRLIQTGEPFDTELQLVTAKGKEVWVRSVSQPDYRAGEIVGFYGTFQDINKEKQEIQEINLLKERLLLANSAADLGVWDWDIKANHLVWDEKMYSIYGVDPSSFSGAYEAWQAGLHPDDRPRGEKELELALSGEKDFQTQFRIITPQGEVRNVAAKATIIRDRSGAPVRMIGMNWDVTKDVKLKKDLLEYNSKMTIVQETLEMAVWKWNPVTNETTWDDKMFEMYDIPKDSPDKVALWESRIISSAVDEIWKGLEEFVKGEKEKYDDVFEVLVKGKTKFIQGKAEIVRKSNGEIDFLIGINIDITDEHEKEVALVEKNKELTDLTERLRISNEKLEEFSYIASHDLKSPIRNMSNLASFIEQDYGGNLGAEGLEFIQGIQSQAKKMTVLVDDLLTYSKMNKVVIDKSEVLIKELITAAAELVGIEDSENINLEIGELGSLIVDGVKFKEVFNNLLTNAIKYNNSNQKEIKVWREGNQLYFKDNGIGIRSEDKDKVFAFFRRLHGKEEFGGGTGAGMAIVKTVLDRHGVGIDYESEVGKGTTFILNCTSCAV